MQIYVEKWAAFQIKQKYKIWFLEDLQLTLDQHIPYADP